MGGLPPFLVACLIFSTSALHLSANSCHLRSSAASCLAWRACISDSLTSSSSSSCSSSPLPSLPLSPSPSPPVASGVHSRMFSPCPCFSILCCPSAGVSSSSLAFSGNFSTPSSVSSSSLLSSTVRTSLSE